MEYRSIDYKWSVPIRSKQTSNNSSKKYTRYSKWFRQQNRRDEDEDNRAWALRCMRMASRMMRSTIGKKSKR